MTTPGVIVAIPKMVPYMYFASPCAHKNPRNALGRTTFAALRSRAFITLNDVTVSPDGSTVVFNDVIFRS